MTITADSSDPDADPDEFEAGNFEAEINLEDWQELARLVPDLLPEEEPTDLLCCRDIDVNYDWSPHVDRYRHPSFSSGEYWEGVRGEQVRSLSVESMPPEAREILNPEQRLMIRSWVTFNGVQLNLISSRNVPTLSRQLSEQPLPV
jgi:ATP-dependent DNA helicase PIF1